MLKFYFLIIFSFFLIKSSNSVEIEEIKISGNKRLTTETIKVIGDINEKINYDQLKLNNLSKTLYESNFFEDISLNIEDKTLFIEVVENPIIENIEITGLKIEKFTEIFLDKISLKSRMPFTNIQLENDINLIKNILKSNGYYFVKVKSSIEKNNNLNSIVIKLEIDQGDRAKIKNINFIGNKKIKDKKLLEVIASEEHKFWKFITNKTYLDQNRINLDMRLLEKYYKNLGFYNVKILSSFVEYSNQNFILTYNIDAGEYFFFNELKLNLPDNYNPNDFIKIQNYFNKIKGEKFSIDSFNKILDDIELIASSRLYDFIDASVQEEVIENNKINFLFNVRETASDYVEKISIFGNITTEEEVIRNQLVVDEGDPLNKILYNKSLDKIKSLNIFKNVESKISEGSTENFKKIDIIVEEQPTGEISLAAGVGTSGTTISGGVTEKNFLGKGINLNTNIELSESSIKGQFIYSRPNFAYTDNTLSTSLKSTSTDNLKDYGYKVSELGFSIGTIFEQYENFFFSPTLNGSFEDLETNNSASANLKKQEGNYSDIYFNYGLNYDLRNSYYRPTDGYRINFYQELPIISDGNELINSISFDKYKKLSNDSDFTGKASIYLKSVNTINNNNDVRISKRANVPYSRLRGFQKGKIGPIDNSDFIGGNYVTSLNLSTNLPFILPTVENFDFSYFIDAANVWGVDYDKSIDDSNFLRSSTGLSVNVLTPIGPLSFSFSKALTKKNTDKTEFFRFNLGTTF